MHCGVPQLSTSGSAESTGNEIRIVRAQDGGTKQWRETTHKL